MVKGTSQMLMDEVGLEMEIILDSCVTSVSSQGRQRETRGQERRSPCDMKAGVGRLILGGGASVLTQGGSRSWKTRQGGYPQLEDQAQVPS